MNTRNNRKKLDKNGFSIARLAKENAIINLSLEERLIKRSIDNETQGKPKSYGLSTWRV